MEHDIKKNILEQVQSGKITPHSRGYFMIQTSLAVLSGIILFIVSIYWVNFLMLLADEYRTFSHVGISLAILLKNILFWLFVILGFGIVYQCFLWLQKHTTLYRYRYWYTVSMLIALVLGTSFAAGLLDPDRSIGRVGEHGIPGLSHIDRLRPPRTSIVTSGRIILTHDHVFMMKSLRDRELLYVRVPEVLIGDFIPGDEVIVFGDRERDYINAYDIIKK